jgi:rubredoxin
MEASEQAVIMGGQPPQLLSCPRCAIQLAAIQGRLRCRICGYGFKPRAENPEFGKSTAPKKGEKSSFCEKESCRKYNYPRNLIQGNLVCPVCKDSVPFRDVPNPVVEAVKDAAQKIMDAVTTVKDSIIGKPIEKPAIPNKNVKKV